MFTGASNAHVAILLVDARAGVLRQTRRHARIAKLLGIKHFVAAVNKIDLVDFDAGRFAEVEAELRQMTDRLGADELAAIPLAAKHGDNVVHRSENTGWYDGPTLLEYLENIELAAPQPEASKLRLPVQWVSRPTAEQRRRYTGRLSAGTLSVGDPVVVLPSGTTSTVTALDTLDDDRTTGVAPLSVSIELADDIDVGAATSSSAVPTMQCCRCRPVNCSRPSAGSPTPRCAPVTGWPSNRVPGLSAPPCRSCTPDWIQRPSTTSTVRLSWGSTTSAG